jgi:membrane-bound serine protease (ClpP class)
MRGVRIVAIVFLLFMAWPGAAHSAESGTILNLRLDGVVDPFESSYLTGQIDSAQNEGFEAILITIDTPGGLDSSMRDIIKSILASDLPVICYVSPQGARAASAGTFILTACNIAAMAPGTEVGAAHPVGVSGVIEQEKVTNDAAAFIKSLAEQRGRNPDWAERAVRDAISASAEEALQLNVIDEVAPTTRSLLQAIDGDSVETAAGTVTLETADAALETRGLGLGAAFLHGLLTPDLAFIFFYLGLGLLIVEFLHPGISIPGIAGVLSLVAAFTAFGMLAVQLVGVILLLASAVFFVLELKYPGVSGAGIGGLITLVLGGLLLFNSSIPDGRVSPWVIAPVAIAVGLFFAFVIPAALKTRKLPSQASIDRVIGMEGVATTALKPQGVAQVASERWTVESVAGNVSQGGRVRVVGAEGLRLKVEPVADAVRPKTSTPV